MGLKQSIVKNYSILHIILLFYSINGIFSKLASKNQFLTFGFFFYYGLVLFNLLIYAILWQQILKKMPLTTAFSNKSVIVVWGMVWGAVLFKEKITITMIIGAVAILGGIYLIASDGGEIKADRQIKRFTQIERRER